MKTYLQKHHEDVARITARSEAEVDVLGKFCFQSGGFRAISQHYARMADHEAANHQRILSDPRRLTETIIDLTPDPAYIATLCYRLAEQLAAHQALDFNADWQQTISALELAGDAAHDQMIAIRRREEDAADALIVSASDDAYDRKVDAALDAGLIGRSHLNDAVPA